MITRVNRRGLQYTITSIKGGVRITHLDKKIEIMGTSEEDISQSWYNWQVRDMLIQVAFHRLSSDEREFILTGITNDEWNEIFTDK